MEEHRDHINLSGMVSNEIANTCKTSGQEDVQPLDVFAAVREILQNILCQSKRAGVHVSIKSTKSSQNTPRKSWFYIKVSSSATVDKAMLEDKIRSPALFTVLGYMQSVENEGHLCIQNPRYIEGEGHHSVQQNLFLQDQRLDIMHEVTRSKHTKDSTLHLRVHQPVWHMMKECTKIHSYLAQTRLFRPRAEMSFTMKVGEAVSETNFMVHNKRKLTETLPSVVTDSVFFLQDSNLVALSETVTPCTVDPLLVSTRCLNEQNEYSVTSVLMSPVASYIQAENNVPGIVTLTLYGPGYLPLTMVATSTLLEDLDWSKYGLVVDGDTTANKVTGLLPCHGCVVLKSSHVGYNIGCFVLPIFILLETLDTTDMALGYQVIEKNVESLLKEHGPKLVGVLQGTLDMVLLPVLNNAKKRSAVIRSISSICKAVTDVVSMSSNEQFRTSVFQSMMVTDTVDLKAELNRRLTDISHKHHHGVWLNSSNSKTPSSRKDIRGVLRHSDDWDTDITGQGMVDLESGCPAGGEAHSDEIDNMTESPVIPEEYFDVDFEDENKTRVGNLHSADKPAFKAGTLVYPLCNSKGQSDLQSDSNDKNARGDNVRRETNLRSPDRTPEISQIVEGKQVSPFHQLADDSPTVGMQMTPDVSQITQGMKDVSPFQELACDHKMGSDSPQAISEDPCDEQIVPESFQGGEMPFVRYSLDPNSHVDTQSDQDSVMACCERSDSSTESCKENFKNNPVFLNTHNEIADNDPTKLFNAHFKIPLSQSDFELLSSEEFGPTLKVVSNFIDEMTSFEKACDLSVTSMFQNDKKPEEYAAKDSHDMKENGKQNGTSTGIMTERLEQETSLSIASDYCKEKHDGDIVDNAGTKTKAEERSQYLDDWFNDVLMEAGEWLS